MRLLLVVILIAHLGNILTNELEGHSPVTAYRHGPGSATGSGERMQIQPWQGHITRIYSNFESRQYVLETLDMILLDTRRVILRVQAFEPLVADLPYHGNNVTPLVSF